MDGMVLGLGRQGGPLLGCQVKQYGYWAVFGCWGN